ncbi:MAG TPA: RluA family pseudouridine synthase [Lachnospiraceae bacterium]|nr:RluA family pseudouridine synthase [Lachnospiraceae bacterium]
MNRSIEYHIPIAYEGYTISQYLRTQGVSAALLVHLKRTPHGIMLNQTWAHVYDLLKENDALYINIIENNELPTIVASKLPVEIVYEDDDIIVINKPIKMPIHPSQNNHDNTLANALFYYYRNEESPFVYRCINRLDKDTTGLVLIAKNMLSSCLLGEQIKQRTIHREYLAIVEGTLEQSGIIDAPISRMANSTIQRCVDYIHGERAVTHFECLTSRNGYSLAKIRLETGRTHQIRVHMKYIGHPLPGDFIYNPNFTQINRQALHSHKLTFIHPITKVLLSFTADLPIDMKQLLGS